MVIREAQAWVALARHGVVLWRTGQLRFRLETFGIYYPAFPYQSSPWRPTREGVSLLIRQSRSYAHWLVEMDEIRTRGRL
jgi:hypothetical protein